MLGNGNGTLREKTPTLSVLQLEAGVLLLYIPSDVSQNICGRLEILLRMKNKIPLPQSLSWMRVNGMFHPEDYRPCPLGNAVGLAWRLPKKMMYSSFRWLGDVI